MSRAFAALPGAHEVDPGPYAIGGTAPGAALRPDSAEEAAAVVRACAAGGLALVPWGGGSALAREAAPPPRYDVALDLRALRRIVHYEPDDFTVTAECGLPLAELRDVLGSRGQELPLEAAAAGVATLGGVLATNASGPRRLAFGAPRDRILGARFVTGDGLLVRTGGRVVKNVAGHAVHRLLVGARGGLGVLVEASLKLPPQPPARAALVHGATAAELADGARWRAFPRREPAVQTVLAPAPATLVPGAAFVVVTGFEGDPAWVDACVAFTRERLGAPARELRDADVPALWQSLADAAEAPGPRLAFASAHHTPDALATALARGRATRLLMDAPAGRLHVWPEPGEAAAAVSALAAAGFTLVDARDAGLEPAPAPASVSGLRARLAAALDPAGAMAYGPRWRAAR